MAALKAVEHTRICWRNLTTSLLLHNTHLEDASTDFSYCLLTKIPMVTKMVARRGDGSRIGRKLREASKPEGHVTWLRIGTSRPGDEELTIQLLHGVSDSETTVDKFAMYSCRYPSDGRAEMAEVRGQGTHERQAKS